jgi:hypothetical protein
MRILIPVLMILRIAYAPIDGTDVEYGQGAVERLGLAHAPLTDTAWLIRVDDPDRAAWQKRLNEAVDPRHGAFTVDAPDGEELARVERGEISFQQ